MDIEVNETGEHAPGAASHRVGRRALLGAGFGGAALSLLPLLSGRASASTPPASDAATTTTAPPQRPTDEDVTLLGDGQRAELAAVDLYDAAIKMGGWSDAQLILISNIREAHNAYGNSLSGLLGRQAPGAASDAVVAMFADGFKASTSEMLDAAYELESALVATHTEILAALQGTNGAALVASVLVAEARHGTVLADLNGKSDAAELLVEKEADSLVGKV